MQKRKGEAGGRGRWRKEVKQINKEKNDGEWQGNGTEVA